MRTYKRKPGSRAYVTNYSADQLDRAVRRVARGESILTASRKHNIPYGTLYNRVHHLHIKKVGTPFRLTSETEQLVVNAVQKLGQWKVPLDGLDVRFLVKSYLDKQGVADNRFKNNLPGIDWLKSFMKRHCLTARLADNVKPSWAEINAVTVGSYFDELECTLEGVDASNIYNYDDMNVSDNPGSKHIICHRGLKRIERKIDHSKSCISLMFCGSATGVYLPPMVVYKAQNVYTVSEWVSSFLTAHQHN